MALGSLLLCAGLGTRLRPYTEQRPKPAIPFWGLPLCDYSLYFLKQAGCQKVVVNLHHLPDIIQKLTLRPELKNFEFTFSLEKEKPLGSGGALWAAQSHLKKFDSFFVINSDEVLIPPTPQVLIDLANHFSKTQALATLLVTDHPDLQKTLKPVWINKEGIIRGFGACPSSSESLRPVHYVGYKIFSQDVLSLLPPGESHIFHDTVVPALKKGALVNTLFMNLEWWETGSLSGLLSATADVTRQVHQFPKTHHLRRVYESFGKDFSFTTEVTPQKVMAVHRTAKINLLNCRGTVFVDHSTEAPSHVRLSNSLVDHSLHLKTDLSDTLELNPEI